MTSRDLRYQVTPFMRIALVVIIIINLLKKIRTEDALQPVSIKLDGPIKGLRSFEREDHTLFLRLQRHATISECCGAILPEDFRFGILIGESGCGKSSLLKAGLLPEIERHNHRAIYVKFSDLAPLQSIRAALKKHPSLPDDWKNKIAGADLAELFDIATGSNTAACLFVFRYSPIRSITEITGK